MMFERFTPEARMTVVHAQDHARRLGHRYIGSEHLLLAVVGTGAPVSAIMRDAGLTPERVEDEILHRTGLGRQAGTGLFGDLDRDALASVGIDLDEVRARIEATFGADALARAAQAIVPPWRPHSRFNPRRAIPPHLLRRWRPIRRARPPRSRVRGGPPHTLRQQRATGRYQGPAGDPDYIPFTPRAKKILERTLREALDLRDGQIGVEHIALALIGTDAGLVPPILDAVDAPAPKLRAAILDRYRKAS
jgi:hypothetical protein